MIALPPSPVPSRRRAGFLAARGGNVAMLFGLILVPLVVVAGAAVDYGRAASVKAKLTGAVDTAALAASRLIMDGGRTDPQVIADATAIVTSQMAQTSSDVGAPTVTVTIGTDEVTVAATVDMETAFLGLMGVEAVTIDEQSVTSYERQVVVDFHILIDTSESMGLAADGDDRAALKAATTDAPIEWRRNCEFACHLSEDTSKEPQSRLALAKGLGLKLRLDAALDGIRLFADLADDNPSRLLSRFSLTAFNSALYPIRSLSDDTGALNAALPGVTIAYGRGNSFPDFGDTLFDQAVTPFAAQAAAQSSAAMPATTRAPYALIISDGVQSGWGHTYPSGALRVFDQSACNALKSAGLKVIVIYTRYYEIPSEPFYVNNVAPIHDTIEPNMRACASEPELFAAADDPAEINAAFRRIYEAVKAQIRIVR